MRRTVQGLLASLLAVLIGLPPTAGPASAETRPRYPVNYNFLENALMYGAQASAPGQNIWTCRPTRRHPRPVVLVHGTAGSAAGNWGTLSAVLANHGYCVFALTYGEAPELAGLPVPVGGMNRLQDSARELARFVAKVRRVTGARKVDLIGHSQGTLMPNHYLKFLGGNRHVLRHVSLAPVWHGTGPALLGSLQVYAAMFGFDVSSAMPVFRAGPQMVAGSPYLARMRAGGVAVDGVRYTNIVSRYDTVVIPYTSGIEPGMRNIVLQDRCSQDLSEHVQIPSSPNVARIVLNTLDPRNARPLRCRLVLPVNGFVS